MRIAIIGAGSWGTTLANILAVKGHATCLWVREPELLGLMQEQKENPWFLPGVQLDPALGFSSELQEVVQGAEVLLMAVPCQYFRSVLVELKALLPAKPVLVCASKGIEVENLKAMSQVVQDELGDLNPGYACLSGPSFAKEVSKGLPTAVSLGCMDQDLGAWLQQALATQTLRVYLNSDCLGVELGGALKNVMALAAGITDGLGFGSGARAALITRGLAEMSRMGAAMGARQETFMGLSGLGDLVLTCTGDLSRNRQVGLSLGQGRKLQEILQGMRMVAEGVQTTRALHSLGQKLGVDLPITWQVYQILYQDQAPDKAVQELMQRTLKQE
ncbi:MAG: NAD(P)H-dependent glycerol-3-phosphate dehydrogenase [Desulfohalobiaceae bacterium]